MATAPPFAATRFIDRRTGAVCEEAVFGGSTLHHLYGTTWGRALTHAVLCRGLPNQLYGLWQRRRGANRRVRAFVESLGIDATEAELPLEAYDTLDAFFTRRLKPEARPVDPRDEVLVSPADGRLLAFPALDGQRLPIKGQQVSIAELLGDAQAPRAFQNGRAYEDGAALVIRLAPADYHRFHFPAAGMIGPAHHVAGPLHSVHPIALGAGAPSFYNKRDVAFLESPVWGTIAIIEVGALCVGTIEQTHLPGPVRRGQEKGLFRFGGSTVVLLFERGRARFDADLLENSARGLETLVRMGTGLATNLHAVPPLG